MAKPFYGRAKPRSEIEASRRSWEEKFLERAQARSNERREYQRWQAEERERVRLEIAMNQDRGKALRREERLRLAREARTKMYQTTYLNYWSGIVFNRPVIKKTETMVFTGNEMKVVKENNKSKVYGLIVVQTCFPKMTLEQRNALPFRERIKRIENAKYKCDWKRIFDAAKVPMPKNWIAHLTKIQKGLILRRQEYGSKPAVEERRKAAAAKLMKKYKHGYFY